MSDPEQVRVYVWRNGATIETVLYPEPLPGEDPADRIHLLVTDQEGNRAGWLMCPEDAMAMIDCLTRAVGRTMEEGFPMLPKQEGDG